jgi:hypothetical protein
MILKNPTDSNLTIKFLGVEHTLDANSSKDFPDDVAEYWRTKLHKFLVVEKQKVVEVKPKETVAEKTPTTPQTSPTAPAVLTPPEENKTK